MQIPKWRQSGVDPDYRFSLANERTFLAWIRTALALLGGSILLEQLTFAKENIDVIYLFLTVTLMGASAGFSVAAYRRWRNNEIAMRHQQSLPFPIIVPLLVTGISVICTIVAVCTMHKL